MHICAESHRAGNGEKKRNKDMNFKNIIIVVVGIVLVAWFGFLKSENKNITNILNFEDCEKAGYPVMESSPRQCKTPEGLTFTEELPLPSITYNNASEELIVVELPLPGSVTGKEFLITGEAKGFWYFEASFPVTVLDKDGNVLVETYATAQEEWMTENFVPFKSEIVIPQTYIGPATLVLEKNNASDLPEHDASISFPIVIEY